MNFELTEEQRALRNLVRDVATRHFANDHFSWENATEYPSKQARILAEHGLTGINLPREVGGQGLGLMEAVMVMQEIALVNHNVADLIHSTNFGAIQQMARFGSERVKREVLPEVLGGHKLATVGMSEPDAGSATTDLRTTARVENGQVHINGGKVFNSRGPLSSYFAVWVRFGERTRDIGMVLVPADAPGFSKGKEERYMSGDPFCSLYFDDCRVPEDYILLREDGFRKQMGVFNIERIGNATRALASAQAAYQMAVNYAQERRQFDRLLCEFQGLQWKFAEMRTKLDAAELLVYRAASRAELDPTETAIAKSYANVVGFEVASEALQIFGGYGFSKELPLESILRKNRGWMIAGGTVEVLKTTIAAGIFGRRFDQRPEKQV